MLAVKIGGREAGEGSVLVLPDEQDVEHADDSAIDEIDEYRDSVAGHRGVRGIRDHHDVDGAKFVFVRFHPFLHWPRRGPDQVASS